MTPFELDILLHYYARADEHHAVVENPPIWRESRQWFIDSNLLKARTDLRANSYEVTERGKVYIEAILALPLPVATWRMP
jgi:hypothetical protein